MKRLFAGFGVVRQLADYSYIAVGWFNGMVYYVVCLYNSDKGVEVCDLASLKLREVAGA
jgi:hypothetical protein